MTVPPDWPSEFPARVALVGEAPAETETLLGRPFVGRAGKTLNGCLRQVGLSRWDCLVTNVFSSRLLGDDVARIGIPRLEAARLLREWEAAHATPEQDARARAKRGDPVGQHGAHPFRSHCLTPIAKGAYLEPGRVADELSRLRAEIERAAPNIVVALGGTACWALLGLPGAGTVSRIRGALTHEILTGRKALASYHPAAVGRNPKLREFLLSDLARALEECETASLVLDERTLLIPEHPHEVRSFLLGCVSSGAPTAIDIETTKGQIDCIGFAPSRTRAMCIPIFHPKHPGIHYWRTPEAELEVINHISWFLATPTPKVWQYGSQYDIQWLWERWRAHTNGLYDDTRLMMHAMNPEQDKDLASIGGTYERLGPWKMMRKSASSKRDD